MKTLTALFVAMAGAAMLAGSAAAADDRCPASHAAAGVCAPLHFVDDDRTEDLLRQRAYQRGYHDALGRHQQKVAPPPAIALDGKEGYSQSYGVHQQYLDRDRQRHYDRDEYRERRLRRNEAGEVVDFATRLLRGLPD